MSIRNMSIRLRLGLGFGLLIVFTVILAAMSLVRLSEFNRGVESFASARVAKLIAAANWVEALLQTSWQMREVLVLDAEKDIKAALLGVHEGGKKRQEIMDKLGKGIVPGKEKDLFQAIVDAHSQYKPHEGEFLKIAEGGDYSAAKKVMMERLRPAQFKYIEVIKQFSDYEVKESAAEAGAVSGSYGSTRIFIFALAALAVLVGATAAVLIIRSLVKQLGGTVQVLEAVATGDLTPRLAVKTQDEFGRMAVALNQALDSMGSAVAAIAQNAQSVASSSEELALVSHKMASNAEETSAQAGVVSAASEQVTKNVQTVATGTEEMSASIKEIAKNANEAAKVASNAVQIAERTNGTVGKLGAASAEIGQVINVINSIAEQTNLLALNATIEAARAGEAGKGFAVVANEVKDLAKQTGKATEEISHKIQAIQSSTKDAVEAIAEIGKVIKQINDISNTIASAVEEQSVTTNEISRNVAEAAKGADEITQNVTGVAEAAKGTASGASDTQTASAELSRMAAELQNLVGQFKYGDATQNAPSAVGDEPRSPRAPS
ncbi:MAG: methyl-accepting chemotaxis protein, partial [Candidatus Binatota bacterium]|nr:methyl-accepting chemotaxis protein [Candidatus Binatota bacterium]